MKFNPIVSAALVLASPLLAEGATPPSASPAICASRCLNPVEAVTYSSYLGNGAGVAGDFGMEVKAVGFDQGRFFLNSELDYRDRNCLTIVIPAALMAERFGTANLDALKQQLIGKRIAVRGVAWQVRIDIRADGSPTGKYYYQTHLNLQGQRNLVMLNP